MTDRTEFEFTEAQNSSFRKLARNLRLVSIALIIVGIILAILGIIGDEFDLLGTLDGITWLLMGLVFYLPIDNFLKITTSEGSDIKELMTGFSELNKGWIVVLVALSLNKIVQIVQLF